MPTALSDHDLAAPIAHAADGPITAGRFHAEVLAWAARLPAGRPVLNTCQDRYLFMVGLGAAAVAGCATLMPSNFAPHTVAQLRQRHPGLMGLHDGRDVIDGLPALQLAFGAAPAGASAAAPLIDDEQVVAIVFTSGSTGEPTAHAKRWGRLCLNGAAEARRLGARGMAIVATVPPQHMYGFESSVLMALHGGASLWHGKPFFPSDICAALAQVPRPRLLVTTPFHLAKLLDAGTPVPACALVLSATAPLPAELARRAEAALAAPLMEIYGCTESGQVASRRPLEDPAWQLLPGVRMVQEAQGAVVHSGHVEGRVTLADAIEQVDSDRFHLIGRHADMVNIAGKRTSLAHLNAQLTAIPGVQDGAFLQLDEGDADTTARVRRLAALVVAPTLDAPSLLAALRRRMDAVFLPRPLLLVDALPRNAASKLVRADLLAAYHAARRARTDEGHA